MRIFVAAMVAVSGIAMFAVAALVLDRRRELIGTPDQPGPLLRLAGRRQPGPSGSAGAAGATEGVGVVGVETGVAGPAGQPPVEEIGAKRYLPHLVALAAVLIGLGLMIGACGGLLSF